MNHYVKYIFTELREGIPNYINGSKIYYLTKSQVPSVEGSAGGY